MGERRCDGGTRWEKETGRVGEMANWEISGGGERHGAKSAERGREG